jgi:hypothetical protein
MQDWSPTRRPGKPPLADGTCAGETSAAPARPAQRGLLHDGCSCRAGDAIRLGPCAGSENSRRGRRGAQIRQERAEQPFPPPPLTATSSVVCKASPLERARRGCAAQLASIGVEESANEQIKFPQTGAWSTQPGVKSAAPLSTTKEKGQCGKRQFRSPAADNISIPKELPC